MSGHARFAPSSAGRLIACPASLVLTEREVTAADADTSGNRYAAEGTLAHWVLSSALMGSMSLVEFRNLVKDGNTGADVEISGAHFPGAWADGQYTKQTIAGVKLTREMVNIACLSVDFVLNEIQDVLTEAGVMPAGGRYWFDLATKDKVPKNDPFAAEWVEAAKFLDKFRKLGILRIEQRVVAHTLMDLSGEHVDPQGFGFGQFKGTADIVLDFLHYLNPQGTSYIGGKTLPYVVGCFDLKYGAGVDVSVRGNAQVLYYLSAALSEAILRGTSSRLAAGGLVTSAPLHGGELVKLGIIQPRTNPNRPIKTDTLTVFDLMLWQGEKLLVAAKRAAEATGAYTRFDMLHPVSMARTVSDQEARAGRMASALAPYLTGGPHCRFCPAAGKCPGLTSLALEVARSQFGMTVDPTGFVASNALTTSSAPTYVPVPNSVADFLP